MQTSYDYEIPAADGFKLAATIYKPDITTGSFIVVNSATAVPRKFYQDFAIYLTGKGYTVITYDYRGIGDSRPDSLRGFKASMRDWGVIDIQGVVTWAKSEFKPDKIIMIGHSIGGQQAGLIANADHIDALVTMSAQSGYWKLQGGNERYKNILQVNLLIPVLSRVFGYFPWSKLAAGEDLPKGVALEWAKWCRNPLYLLGDKTLPLERFENFKAPVLAYSFEDDNWGTAASVAAMMSAYPQVEYRHVSAQDEGIKYLGHVGFFRERAKPLWDEMLAWIENRH